MRRLIRSVARRKEGTTLVELVITFALICIFFGGITMVLMSCLRVYQRAQQLGGAISVSETLLDRVYAELQGATLSSPEDRMIVQPELVSLNNGDGDPILITAEDGLLLIHYGPESARGRAAVDWAFDEAAYLGYRIDSLQFRSALSGDPELADYGNNVLRIDLTLSGPEGTFSFTRYVRCRNFLPDTTRIRWQPQGTVTHSCR